MKRIGLHILLPLLSGALVLVPLIATGSDSLSPQARTDLNPKDLKRVERVTRPTADFSKAEQFETMSGGAATTKAIVNGDAFSHFSPNITFEEEQNFKLGNALFTKLWVSAPPPPRPRTVSDRCSMRAPARAVT
ncbi:hypothetical protein N7E02_17405 [Aliirhizobium terrae]|uniref:hypothetical protein n=1 Tax=Terrirhizobium terrae TaxID=2926709 RepID=UPI0025754E13|nr:hypothetical protein [Rhizobium sp. CC-CFT758]WJH41987.1 hypothetical protein N7E02_17405 [Rhizobium sp. CC-CFT758]